MIASERAERAIVWKAEPGASLGAIFGGIVVLLCIAVGVLGLDRLPGTFCVFKAVTGRPCLTCGSTRVLGRLFALDPGGAFLMNPLVAVVTFGVFAWAMIDLALLPRRLSLSVEFSPQAARITRIAAIVLPLLNWGYLLAVGR